MEQVDEIAIHVMAHLSKYIFYGETTPEEAAMLAYRIANALVRESEREVPSTQ